MSGVLGNKKRSLERFLVVHNSPIRSHLIYPLIRAMNKQFGSNNVQLLTANKDEKERKINCREVRISGGLGDAVEECLKYEEVVGGEDEEKEEVVRIKKEFMPTWILDLTTYNFDMSNLKQHMTEVSTIGKDLKAK